MKRSSEDVFRELYQTYYGDIYRYVYQSVQNKEQVEEWVQEVFLTAQRNLGKFGGEVGYKTWLFSIAHQTIGSLWRKVLRRKKSEEQQAPDPETEDNGYITDSERERRRRYEQLIRELGRMTDNDRDVIVLGSIHQFSVADTAVIMHTTDGRVRLWMDRAGQKLREDWEEGSEGLEQAFETARYLPTDYDLAQSKTVGWEQVQQRQKRRSRLLTRWLPAAGMLTTAAVVLLVWQASGNELKPGPSGGKDVPAVATEEGKEQADQGNPAEHAYRDAWNLKQQLYAERGQSLMLADPESKIDMVREGQSKLYMIKDEQQVLVVDIPDAMSIDISAFHPPTMLIQARIRGSDEFKPDFYYYHMDRMELKQIPLQGLVEYNLNFWGPDRQQIVYLSYDSERKGQSVLNYDLTTGETTVLREAEDIGPMAHVWMNGDTLMLVSAKQIEYYEGGTWNTVYKGHEYDLEMHNANDETILFHVGVSPGGAGRSRNGSDYAGTKRVMMYDRQQKSAFELMPNVEGEQDLVYAAAGPRFSRFLLTSFVPDPVPEGQEGERNRPGQLHFYEVERGREPQLIHTRPTAWFDSQLFRESHMGPLEKEVVLIPAVAGDPTKLFRLRYLPDEHRIEEIPQESGSGS